jgi:hypothetical protein
VLKPGDRVVILGEPSVLKTVSEILTFDFQQFPLEYGSIAISYLTGREDENFFNEINYIFSIFPLKRIVFLCSSKTAEEPEKLKELLNKDHIKNQEIEKTELDPLDAITKKAEELNNEDGLIVLSDKFFNSSFFTLLNDQRKKTFLYSLSKKIFSPILISFGTFPYEKMLVPCGEGLKLQNVLETSLEISTSLNNEATALLVRPSKYISTEGDFNDFDERKKTISDVALMYKMSIKTEIRDGNPVKVAIETCKDYNLMLIDTDGWQGGRFLELFSPDIIWHLVKRSFISTLLIPPLEEAL